MTVRAEGLAYGWPERLLGRGLWLEVPAGSLGFLLGPNDAGKTTLLKTLLGLQPALGGEVTLDGRGVRTMSRQRIARSAAYVPQALDGDFPYSVLDTVLMGCTAHLGALSSPGAGDRRIAMASLERLGIADLAARPFTRLSAGQRQLVLIARAIAQRVSTILLDEPTASLDLRNARRVLAVLRELADAGHAVLATTHDPNQALAYGDSAMLMRDGEIFARGEPAQVIDADSVSRLYGIDVAVVRTVDGPRVFGRSGTAGAR